MEDPMSNYSYLGFIFFSTLIVYNTKGIHAILTKNKSVSNSLKIQWALKNKFLIRIIYCISILSCIYFSLLIPPSFLFYIIPLSIISILYSVPFSINGLNLSIRQIPYLKTLIVAVTWLLIVTILPLKLNNSLSEEYLTWILNEFLFLLALSVLFDIKDTQKDHSSNLKTIPVVFGYSTTKGISVGLLSLKLLLLLRYFDRFVLPETIITLLSIILIYFLMRKDKQESFYMGKIDSLMIVKFIISALYFSI